MSAEKLKGLGLGGVTNQGVYCIVLANKEAGEMSGDLAKPAEYNGAGHN